MRVSKMFIISPWSGQCLSGWQQLSLGKEYSGEVNCNAPWCIQYPMWRSRAACCSRISAAGPARLRKGLDCRWAADPALSLKVRADGNLSPEQEGCSDCSSAVLQMSWKDYVLPGPGPGTAPQFQVQVPAHRSKADTTEQLFLLPAYEFYPEISWGMDNLYMQLLSECDDSILKSNTVYICC